jgi:hypothetical protein
LKLCEGARNHIHENVTVVLIILFRDDAGEYNFKNTKMYKSKENDFIICMRTTLSPLNLSGN